MNVNKNPINDNMMAKNFEFNVALSLPPDPPVVSRLVWLTEVVVVGCDVVGSSVGECCKNIKFITCP